VSLLHGRFFMCAYKHAIFGQTSAFSYLYRHKPFHVGANPWCSPDLRNLASTRDLRPFAVHSDQKSCCLFIGIQPFHKSGLGPWCVSHVVWILTSGLCARTQPIRAGNPYLTALHPLQFFGDERSISVCFEQNGVIKWLFSRFFKRFLVFLSSFSQNIALMVLLIASWLRLRSVTNSNMR